MVERGIVNQDSRTRRELKQDHRILLKGVPQKLTFIWAAEEVWVDFFFPIHRVSEILHRLLDVTQYSFRRWNFQLHRKH